MFFHTTTLQFLVVVLTAYFLGGCALHSVDEEASLLEVETPSNFSEASTGSKLPSEWNHSWWESFEDKDLSRLIEAGLAGSFDLRQHVARINQATELARQAGSRLYPSLNFSTGLGGRVGQVGRSNESW